jgi:hypothetical protein
MTIVKEKRSCLGTKWIELDIVAFALQLQAFSIQLWIKIVDRNTDKE